MGDTISRVAIGQIQQRITNKAGAAGVFDVELTTLNRWIRKGCPVNKAGDRGKSWELDLLAVAEWHYGGQRSTGESKDPNDYSPTDRRAWFESELKRRELETVDRGLIESSELEPAIITAFARFSQSTQSIGDTLERRHGVTADIAEIVEKALFDFLDEVADTLEQFGPTE